MIWNPYKGQSVVFRYRKSLRPVTGLHEKIGTVVVVSTGPKTKNVLVHHLGKLVVVPRGNLFVQEGMKTKKITETQLSLF